MLLAFVAGCVLFVVCCLLFACLLFACLLFRFVVDGLSTFVRCCFLLSVRNGQLFYVVCCFLLLVVRWLLRVACYLLFDG